MGYFPTEECVACGSWFYGKGSDNHATHCAELIAQSMAQAKRHAEDRVYQDAIIDAVQAGKDPLGPIMSLAAHYGQAICLREGLEQTWFPEVPKIQVDGKVYVWLSDAVKSNTARHGAG